MTTSSSSSKGHVCKQCNKPGFKNAEGKMQHERRANPGDYGGRRTDPKSVTGGKGGKAAADTGERAPDREHVLNRRVFGGQREE